MLRARRVFFEWAVYHVYVRLSRGERVCKGTELGFRNTLANTHWGMARATQAHLPDGSH